MQIEKEKIKYYESKTMPPNDYLDDEINTVELPLLQE